MRRPTRNLQIFLVTAGLTALLAAAPATASPAEDYMLYCMGCHGADARGVPGKVPALAGSLALFMRSPEGRDYVLRVPGAANSALSDAQLSAVLNWIAERYGAQDGGPASAAFTVPEVARIRHVPLASVQVTRREVVRQLAAAGSAPPADY
jgi:mono/diheme cytochrome c family protein